MRHPNADEIKRFMNKLETEGDISLSEADRIFSLFSENSIKTKLNPHSYKYDYGLLIALVEWYKAVGEAIGKGNRGNFIFTIPTTSARTFWLDGIFTPARVALKRHGKPEDLCTAIMMDGKTFSVLPFKHLFKEVKLDADLKSFYEMKIHRAGMYHYPIETSTGTYTIARFMKQFSPVAAEMQTDARYLPLAVFQIAVGAKNVSRDSFLVVEYEVKLYILAEFMKRNDMSCVAVMVPLDKHNNGPIIFVENKEASIIKKILEIPFEKLVKNALSQKIINEETARNLLSRNRPLYWDLPVKAFVETNAGYIDDLVKMKKQWEAEREVVKEEDDWLEQER